MLNLAYFEKLLNQQVGLVLLRVLERTTEAWPAASKDLISKYKASTISPNKQQQQQMKATVSASLL